MSSKLIDSDSILSENEEWVKLEREWGSPVDLETEEDYTPSKLKTAFSTLDLKTTFDSAFLFKKRQRVGRRISKTKNLEYKNFFRDLHQEAPKESPSKQFYFINGQLLSAISVEEICDSIDEIFKSVDKLCSATSTIRIKKVKKIPEYVECSISTDGLSFDDTEKEKSDCDIDQFIDEAFQQLNTSIATTIASLSCDNLDEESKKGTVTALVKKFSNLLEAPRVRFSPRSKRECSDKFKDLAEYWKSRALES